MVISDTGADPFKASIVVVLCGASCPRSARSPAPARGRRAVQTKGSGPLAARKKRIVPRHLASALAVLAAHTAANTAARRTGGQ